MENSKIEWTDHTFNPWQGCLKVSPGCQHCYAETLSNRWGKDIWGPGAKRQRTSAANWRKPIQWNREAKAKGVRYKVFCASMADVFEDNPQVSDWRSDLWDLIELTPNLDWLLLTKRPENVLRFTRRWTPENYGPEWPDNIWLGTSVENQEYADKRIPELLKIPARVRFLSCEPLLGPINLTGKTVDGVWVDQEYADLDPGLGEIVEEEGWPIHWVITGGESGPHSRPMHPEWARSLRDQCQAAGVAFFFKQWGNWIPKTETHYWDDEKGWMRKDEWIDTLSRPGKWGNLNIDGRYLEFTTTWNSRQNDPSDDYEVTVYELGKKATGRMLDGQTWDEFPALERVY